MAKSRSGLWLLSGLAVGFFLGIALSQNDTTEPTALGSIIEKRIQESQGTPVKCGADVDTEGWTTFRDNGLAIEFKYPGSYKTSVDGQNVTIAPENGNPDGVIVLEKFYGLPQREVTRDWQMATWKIADRKTFAMTSGYFNDDQGKLWTKFVFIRDFPFGTTGQTWMVRATIAAPISAEEYASARAAGVVDYESLLTLPEQILSTFRFYQNEELPLND